MTLEELREIQDKWSWVGGASEMLDAHDTLLKVFEAAEAMLMLEEMGSEVSFHGYLTLSRPQHGEGWMLFGRKPTHEVAEFSAAAAIRAAYEEWSRDQK